MKKYWAILFVIVAITSCKKEKTDQTVAGLTGKWELSLQSDITGIHTYALGAGNTLQFNADSTFIQYRANQLVDQGSYHVIKNGITIPSGFKFDALYYNHSTFSNELQIKPDTLFIITGPVNAAADTYVRQ